jgi:integrase/recombinase XerD
MARQIRQDRHALPIEAWPAIDRKTWETALQPKGLFDAGHDYSHLREASRKRYFGIYARWLRFLSVHFPALLFKRPASRVTKVTVKCWLDTMQDLSSLSRWSELGGLVRVLAIIEPETDFDWLRRLVRRLDAVAEPLTPAALKARDSEWLLERGLTYMDAVDLDLEHRALMGSSAYRDGLMVAFLALHPLRRRSLAALTLTQHVQVREDSISISLRAEDLKYGDGLTFNLARRLAPYFRTYLNLHRPRLLQGNPCDSLWISYEGRGMTEKSVGDRFWKATERILGERISMHAFRHSAASTWAERTPETAMLIAALLGHTTLRTAERHYIGGNRKIAAVRFNSILDARRAALQGNMEK